MGIYLFGEYGCFHADKYISVICKLSKIKIIKNHSQCECNNGFFEYKLILKVIGECQAVAFL
jgi:hypothetical protein